MIPVSANFIRVWMSLILVYFFGNMLDNLFLFFVLSSDDMLKAMIFLSLQWQSAILRDLFVHQSMMVQLFLRKFNTVDLKQALSYLLTQL